MDQITGQRVIRAKERVVEHFNGGDWEELGLLTGELDYIQKHPRLLRSLSWQDEDYASNALSTLIRIAQARPQNIGIVEAFLDQKYPGESHYISAKPSERKITFAPSVFHVPDALPEADLVAVMMPFAAEFAPIQAAVRGACEENKLRCLRADDLWIDSAIIQDIFALIYRAQVVVVDFTGKNPNVMYETGIAHTLGKHVVPIAQSVDDVPSDMRHHRALTYLRNGQGLADLRTQLAAKLKQFAPHAAPWDVAPARPQSPPPAFDDDIPF